MSIFRRHPGDVSGLGDLFDGGNRLARVEAKLAIYTTIQRLDGPGGESQEQETGFTEGSGHLRLLEEMDPLTLSQAFGSHELRLVLDDGRAAMVVAQGSFSPFEPPTWIPIAVRGAFGVPDGD